MVIHGKMGHECPNGPCLNAFVRGIGKKLIPFLAVFLFLHEPLQGFGLFDGREILAEQVLNQRDFGGVALHTDPGDGRKAGKLGSLEAALAGDEDQVGAVGVRAEEKWLDDADARDRCGQLLQRLCFKG